MSTLANVYQIEFDAFVKEAYQSKGNLLKDTVRNKTNFVGSSVDFRKADYAVANIAAFHQVVQYQDLGFDKVNCPCSKYNCAVSIDEMEQFTTNIDERRESAMMLASAIGRRTDQIIIDALSASGTSNVIVNGGTNLTYAKLTEVNEYFESLAIPPEMRHIAISAAGMKKLYTEDEFINNEYLNLSLVKAGTLNGNFAMGMNFHIIPTMVEGGLPKSGNIRDCFAWHNMSTGYAYRDFATRLERVPNYDSDQALAKIYAGAVAVDAVGIIKVQIDETA